MKKLFMVILSLSMALPGLSGCFSNDEGKDSSFENSSFSSIWEDSTSNGDSSEDSVEKESSEESSSEESSENSEESSSEESASANKPNEEIVPPITDGGDFDGTV